MARISRRKGSWTTERPTRAVRGCGLDSSRAGTSFSLLVGERSTSERLIHPLIREAADSRREDGDIDGTPVLPTDRGCESAVIGTHFALRAVLESTRRLTMA